MIFFYDTWNNSLTTSHIRIKKTASVIKSVNQSLFAFLKFTNVISLWGLQIFLKGQKYSHNTPLTTQICL